MRGRGWRREVMHDDATLNVTRGRKGGGQVVIQNTTEYKHKKERREVGRT